MLCILGRPTSAGIADSYICFSRQFNDFDFRYHCNLIQSGYVIHVPYSATEFTISQND